MENKKFGQKEKMSVLCTLVMDNFCQLVKRSVLCTFMEIFCLSEKKEIPKKGKLSSIHGNVKVLF